MIIKRPLITEKNNELISFNSYAFEVDRKASKTQIKKAVEKYFGVKVKSVRTSNERGRARRTSRGVGSVPYWKKAIVRLHKDEKITLLEGG